MTVHATQHARTGHALPATQYRLTHRFFRSVRPNLLHGAGRVGPLLTTTMASPSRPGYALGFSRETERRLLRCRASLRAAIRERLESIALEAAKPGRRLKQPGRKEPPLRFYVYEGYRVVYQVDEQTRRVVVLDLTQVLS
jgi:mRNA-degrading endonuclease RelE of RelBE toxin-antitoxin system